MISPNTFHSFIDQRQRLAIVSVPIHTVTITSNTSFHSGYLAITVILRGPDGDRYGQVLLYLLF